MRQFLLLTPFFALWQQRLDNGRCDCLGTYMKHDFSNLCIMKQVLLIVNRTFVCLQFFRYPNTNTQILVYRFAQMNNFCKYYTKIVEFIACKIFSWHLSSSYLHNDKFALLDHHHACATSLLPYHTSCYNQLTSIDDISWNEKTTCCRRLNVSKRLSI